MHSRHVFFAVVAAVVGTQAGCSRESDCKAVHGALLRFAEVEAQLANATVAAGTVADDPALDAKTRAGHRFLADRGHDRCLALPDADRTALKGGVPALRRWAQETAACPDHDCRGRVSESLHDALDANQRDIFRAVYGATDTSAK